MVKNLRQRLSALFKPRSAREASEAIDHELTHHLAESIDRLIDEGYAPEEARAEAERRFGDVGAIRAELIDRALMPNRRLTVIAVAMTVGVTAVFSAILIGQRTRIDENQTRILQIASELERLRAQVGNAESGVRGSRIPMAQTVNFITIDGAVGRPLVWTFSRRDDVTLRKLIARSGGLTATASGRISISRMRLGRVVEQVELTAEQWNDPAGPDPILDGSYYIYAEPLASARIEAPDEPAMTSR